MLPIAQRIKSAPTLKAQPKAVLIEVCELFENGGRGACFISNDELAKKLGISLATAVRTVKHLVDGGLLQSQVVKAEGNRRYLTPTADVRACYTGPTAAQLLAVANLTIVKKEPTPLLTIVKNESDYSQKCEVTIVKTDADYSQNASRVLGDNQYNHSYNQEKEVEALRSALAAAEKKIAEQAAELEEITRQRNALRNSLAAVRPASAGASASHTGGGAASPHKFPFSQSKAATAVGLQALTERLGYGAAYLPHYLAHMATKAEGMEPRDEKGWQNFAQRFLANDATSETGLITTPPNDSAHASLRPTSPQQRSTGQKPTGNAGQMARQLAERRRGSGQ